MRKITPKGMWQVLKQAGAGFSRNKVPKLSASLAYYTIFSIGPMLIVIIFLADVFLRRQAVEGTIYAQINGLVGSQAALQVQEIIKNAAIHKNNRFMAMVGFVTLLVGATTVFAEIQDSINTIWNLKVKAERGFIKMVINRLLSFSLVVSLGFLLLVSLIVNGLLEGLMDRLQKRFPELSFNYVYVTNLVVTLVVIGLLFAIIFKVLPDAKIHWRDVGVGAVFTAILFMAGKFGITFYIGKSNIGSTYGAAGSTVLLLVWVYFSAIILYFGAEFTKAYALKYGSEIKPNDYAVMVQVLQVESHKNSVQENEINAAKTEAALQKKKDDMNQPSQNS